MEQAKPIAISAFSPILVVFIIIGLYACDQIAEPVKAEDLPSLNTGGLPDQRAKQILKAYRVAKDSKGTEKYQNDIIFLSLFPNSFAGMNRIFGYDNEEGPGPLYDNGNEIITYFSELQLKEKQAYFEKYINICINGKWQADNIRDAFGIHQRILNDADEICTALSKKSDEELLTVFQFIFDGPHPRNELNAYRYAELMNAIPDTYPRIKKLLTDAYEILINEDHSH